MSSGPAVVDVVARCRRRIRMVSAARRAGFTVPLAIVVVEGIVLAARPAAAQIATLSAAAMAVAGIAAAFAAVLRPLTMRAAAAELDTRLHLQDRIVTALHVVSDDDPMAQLVLRDAESHLGSISPRAVFPLEAPSHFGAMLIVMVCSTAVLLLITGTSGRSWLSAGGGTNGAAGAGSGRSGRSLRSGPNAQTADNRAPSVAETRPRQATQTAANRNDTPVGRESVRADADTDARGSARGGSGPRSGADARTTAPGRNATSAAGARDGGRGATGFSVDMASAAGGVNGVRSSTSPPAPPRASAATAPGDAAYRDQYRAASAHAQAAIAQERVPVRLRTYVSRYFVAIHP
jgi:hypothetical protein